VTCILVGMASEQTHCDWCYGPIDDEDRRRSSELGIDDESAWACGYCMDLRLLLDPPEWWEGDPDNWPVKDLKDQVKLAEDNVKIVLSDVDRSIGLRPRVTVDTYRTAVRIAYDDSYTTPSVFAESNPQALAETADYLQKHVAEDIWSPWPVCPIHDVGVHAEVRDHAAVWWCRFGTHLVAPVGMLGLA
jgi:hypothetical protein